MREIIKKQYNYLLANTDDFREFANKLENMTAEEVIETYGIQKSVNAYCFALQGMQE